MYAELGRLVVRWEKLRIVYNIVLTLVVLLTSLPFFRECWTDPEFVLYVLSGCLGANACFLAGPMVDGYLSWFGLRHPAITTALFIVGTAFAALLTTVAVFSFGWPIFD